MKIYVEEMPENCYKCSLCGKFKPPAQRPEIECNLAKKFNLRSEFCILNDLRLHDKQVRADERKGVIKQLIKFMVEEKYDEMVEFLIDDNFTEEEFVDFIDKIKEAEE